MQDGFSKIASASIALSHAPRAVALSGTRSVRNTLCPEHALSGTLGGTSNRQGRNPTKHGVHRIESKQPIPGQISLWTDQSLDRSVTGQIEGSTGGAFD